MTMAKLAVMAAIGCLATTMQTNGQLQARKPELTQDQKDKLTHYQKVYEDLQTKLKDVRHAIGKTGTNLTGEKLGLDRLEELSKRIALLKEEQNAVKRLISRAESKQKVLKTKLIRIEKELTRALEEMPNDPVAQALKKLVEIDESAYTLMKKRFEAGQIPSDELSTAERKLAESRLELAKHQWEESAEARKALAAASSALEESVFETEMQVSEKDQLAEEIAELSDERGRLEALVLEASEISMRSADVQHLMGTISEGFTDAEGQVVDRLRQKGVNVYESKKPPGKPATPAKGAAK